MEFQHNALEMNEKKKLVYTAMSKNLSYFKEHISKFVLEKGHVPLNPFMSFNYFLLDTLSRDIIREANNNYVRNSEEVWVFGPVSDGVMAEIEFAKEFDKQIKFFEIINDEEIRRIDRKEVKFEDDIKEYKKKIQ
ncbi:MAG: hypothetical protein ABEK36_04155 [Candidatus Aenigmatarchaeota archaeon]